MNSPRQPTPIEIQQLITTLRIEHYVSVHDELESLTQLVEDAHIAVWDHYRSEYRDGYYGKLMSVVWPLRPCDYEVYVWDSGQLQRVRQSPIFDA